MAGTTDNDNSSMMLSNVSAPWPAEGLEEVKVCPVCGSTDRELLYERLTDRVFFCAPGEWRLYHCLGCRSAYLDPRPTPGTVGLAYQTYFTHSEPASPSEGRGVLQQLKVALKNGYLYARYGIELSPRFPLGRWGSHLLLHRGLAIDRNIRHLALPKPGARLVDIGCGNGRFLRLAQALGWDLWGLEPDPQAVAAAQAAGLHVVQGGFPDTGLPDRHFDAVTLNHVIEHVHDPLGALQEIHRILKPGGQLWIATPNINSLGHARFGRYWRGLEPPRHLVLFNLHSLIDACTRTEFHNVCAMRLPYLWGRYLFRESLKIAQGEDPYGLVGSGLSIRQLFELRLTGLRALYNPAIGEELVVLATKAK